ncbi:PAXNEB protein [Sarocladium implicatum]|nr:PAXNEB protein [Sarocladium implicatum]
MSFKKRNVVIGAPSGQQTAPRQEKQLSPGTRPSPLDGRLTTSTGTASLDQLLAGHSGLPMGHSLFIEEASTTDFGGILLRYYTAEGLVQGHHVHVFGFDDSWRRELPGLDLTGGSKDDKRKSASTPASDDKMKIAWRYEALGNRTPSAKDAPASSSSGIFCHSFNLTKRLENSAVHGQLFASPIGLPNPSSKGLSPLTKFIEDVTARIKSSGPSVIHRIVVPSLLSPTIYPSSMSKPEEVLQFLHSLRALLRSFPTQLTAMISMPVSLYPRSTGLTRWAELLCDGVLELIPLEHKLQLSRDPSKEDKAQGMLRAHSLPVFHEKGGGLEGSWNKEDLSFKLSSSSGLVITPFSLPPIGDEEEKKKDKEIKGANEAKKESLEF